MLQVTREYRVSILLGNGNETRTFYWCRENWPNQEMRKIYTTVLFANIYLAPLTLIVIMYARIGVTLCKTSVPASRGHSSSGGGGRHESRQMVSRKKKRVVKMLVTWEERTVLNSGQRVKEDSRAISETDRGRVR